MKAQSLFSGTAIGGHHSARWLKVEWLTPPYVLKALGEFDLDPCSPLRRPWDTAREHMTVAENGLRAAWRGRVWLNPPYGRETGKWLARLAAHRDGIALLFARTETDDFHEYIWKGADAVFFFRGRINFHHVDGRRAEANAGAPSCLVAYGARNVDALERSGLPGKVIRL